MPLLRLREVPGPEKRMYSVLSEGREIYSEKREGSVESCCVGNNTIPAEYGQELTIPYSQDPQ